MGWEKNILKNFKNYYFPNKDIFKLLLSLYCLFLKNVLCFQCCVYSKWYGSCLLQIIKSIIKSKIQTGKNITIEIVILSRYNHWITVACNDFKHMDTYIHTIPEMTKNIRQ